MMPSVSCKRRDPRCRVLQYVHGLLIVSVAGDDSSPNADKWVMAYGSKEDLILDAMAGFYLNDIW